MNENVTREHYARLATTYDQVLACQTGRVRSREAGLLQPGTEPEGRT